MDDAQKIIAEYSAEYCAFLEAAYGKGMMSEGGAPAIDKMFDHAEIHGRKALDVGFGLGGVAFYLADTYQTEVTGIELNPWLVQEAERRTPEHLKGLVRFVQYPQPNILPFDNASFDVVYSKGVLTHVADKTPLFSEIHRVLKPGGQVVIDDWLSPVKGQWGKRLQKMCEVEDLTLYAETEAGYRQLLQEAGFTHTQMRDENQSYAGYNRHIVACLQQPDNVKRFSEQFGATALQEAVECYRLIADSIADNELLIRWFQADKPKCE